MIFSYHSFLDENDFRLALFVSGVLSAETVENFENLSTKEIVDSVQNAVVFDIIGEVETGSWCVNAAWFGEIHPSFEVSRIYPEHPIRVFAGAPPPNQPEPPIPVPSFVPLWCGRVVLKQAGLWNSIVLAVSADDVLSEWLEYGSVWERNDPRVSSIATSLGLSSSQVDDMFRAAAVLAGSRQ